MKKIIILSLLLLFIVGCSDENSLVKENYIDNHSYSEIYQDLSNTSHEVSYFPTKKAEKHFYEIIEVIRDNHDKFNNDELTSLYNLININYNFKYNEKRYNNTNFQNDLNIIKNYITE